MKKSRIQTPHTYHFSVGFGRFSKATLNLDNASEFGRFLLLLISFITSKNGKYTLCTQYSLHDILSLISDKFPYKKWNYPQYALKYSTPEGITTLDLTKIHNKKLVSKTTHILEIKRKESLKTKSRSKKLFDRQHPCKYLKISLQLSDKPTFNVIAFIQINFERKIQDYSSNSKKKFFYNYFVPFLWEYTLLTSPIHHSIFNSSLARKGNTIDECTYNLYYQIWVTYKEWEDKKRKQENNEY